MSGNGVHRVHPDADVVITGAMVERLIAEQCPKYAGLPVRRAAHGWDNEMWRLGDELAVRMPRRREGVALLLNEARWLGEIAAASALPMPVPIFAGEPNASYPYPWVITSWLPGEPASSLTPRERDNYARDLAEALRQIHRPAPEEAPTNPVRGVPLTTRTAAAHARLDRLAERGGSWREDVGALRGLLDRAAAAPVHDRPPVWIHGDPHPYNVLATQGRLSALVDFGDLGSGDPASDLGAAWLHFTPAGLADFWAAYGGPKALYERAQGWAVTYVGFMVQLDPEHPLHACGVLARDNLRTAAI